MKISIWKFLKKLKMELPYNPAISQLGIHLTEFRSAYNRDICPFMFISTLFIIIKVWS
jgi:hypothetical protein